MPLVDLELMVFFIRGRKIALFGRRWHKTQKKQKMQKIVEISLASRLWSQPQRHARLPPLYNFAVGGAFALKSRSMQSPPRQLSRNFVLVIVPTLVPY